MRQKTIMLLLFSVVSLGLCQAQNYLFFKANQANSTLSYINKEGNSPDIQISADNGQTWTPFTGNDTVTLKKKGDKVLLKGNNPDGFSHAWNVYTQFCMTGSISAGGNVMTLIDESGKSSNIPNDDCFTRLFAKCDALTSAPDLPATHLMARCYASMFWYCSNLQQMPQLPAKTLSESCYKSMFAYCASLTQIAPLPATILADYCYESMFSYCSGLAQAPLLPAKEVKKGCYKKMFFYCVNLVQAPQLPAKEVAEHCYEGMFGNCESMKSAPSLPAKKTEEFCYSEMFASCSSLTQAPYISATKLGKYSCKNMFYGCSSLNQIRVKFTKWSDATNLWVDKTNKGGTFVCPSSLPTKFGVNQIPVGWRVSKKK